MAHSCPRVFFFSSIRLVWVLLMNFALTFFSCQEVRMIIWDVLELGFYSSSLFIINTLKFLKYVSRGNFPQSHLEGFAYSERQYYNLDLVPDKITRKSSLTHLSLISSSVISLIHGNPSHRLFFANSEEPVEFFNANKNVGKGTWSIWKMWYDFDKYYMSLFLFQPQATCLKCF